MLRVPLGLLMGELFLLLLACFGCFGCLGGDSPSTPQSIKIDLICKVAEQQKSFCFFAFFWTPCPELRLILRNC
jgi:hypothetical protein